MAESLRERLGNWLLGPKKAAELASVTVRVDDSDGWESINTRGHDRTAGEIEEMYRDSLQAWRSNPMGFRIVQTITDYVLGDKIVVSTEDSNLQKFIRAFWNHPENNMENRLETMCEELSRAGDLFVLLFRNDVDGMSYIRFLTKDQVRKIVTSKNDWEKELIIVEKPRSAAGDTKNWYTPNSKRSNKTKAIILHYTVNRPLGALMGEGDLNVVIPWLSRYKGMLEDRARLNWAMRAFLWVITVPTDKIESKREQYKVSPKSGTVIVKDEGEKWEVHTPNLRGADASHDMRAVRQMIDAGAGQPPHWRGEGENVNLATATAMQAPVERHLLRRQKYFTWVIQDILYHAYKRSEALGFSPALTETNYERLFTVDAPDISRRDNVNLAKSARDLTLALKDVAGQLPDKSSAFNRLMLRLTYKFLGEPQDDEMIDEIMAEVANGHSENGGENATNE